MLRQCKISVLLAETSSIHCVPKIEKNKSNTALLRALINNIDVLG